MAMKKTRQYRILLTLAEIRVLSIAATHGLQTCKNEDDAEILNGLGYKLESMYKRYVWQAQETEERKVEKK